jgi:hypothetical protein
MRHLEPEMDATDELVERIARRVAELLRNQAPRTADEQVRSVRLVDAATLAARLGVRREWVYRHARQLEAIRLGGPRGRLRFDLDLALSLRPPASDSDSETGPVRSGRSSGLGVAGCTTYSRKGSTKSGRAARQRPRPDTGRTDHPMHGHRSAEGGRR